MTRLTRQEAENLLHQLASWQTPGDMRQLVDTEISKIGSETLFNQGGLAFIRDAWIAAEFAVIRKAEKVRLMSDNWPDFELMIDGQAVAFEAVEADDPDRRRGHEYKKGLNGIQDDPVEDWIARAEQAPVWIEKASRKKADKKYAQRTNLVIYLNLSDYGIRQTEVESCFRSATESARVSFDSIWILWKKKAYRVWPIGNSAEG